ncbi:hypothetical protein TNCV_4302581 [Trichonephila clavipes]|nr:hypothetical protein TNCV_4302581 [Trichonephila clavipes]
MVIRSERAVEYVSPYSPDMSSRNLDPFPKLKEFLRGEDRSFISWSFICTPVTLKKTTNILQEERIGRGSNGDCCERGGVRRSERPDDGRVPGASLLACGNKGGKTLRKERIPIDAFGGISPREKYKEDRCFGIEGQPQPGLIFVSAFCQDSVPSVFWRVDELAAFPQPVQDNP